VEERRPKIKKKRGKAPSEKNGSRGGLRRKSRPTSKDSIFKKHKKEMKIDRET